MCAESPPEKKSYSLKVLTQSSNTKFIISPEIPTSLPSTVIELSALFLASLIAPEVFTLSTLAQVQVIFYSSVNRYRLLQTGLQT